MIQKKCKNIFLLTPHLVNVLSARWEVRINLTEPRQADKLKRILIFTIFVHNQENINFVTNVQSCVFFFFTNYT